MSAITLKSEPAEAVSPEMAARLVEQLVTIEGVSGEW